jgi:hypothetical protein
MNDLAAMGRLLEALRPWLSRVVIVGGWAHRLYRHHPLAEPPSFLPLLTRDADVAFSPDEPMRGDIAAALAAAGFVQELSGEHTPPVSRYWLGEDDGGFYAEFLAPLKGSVVKRSGRYDATVLNAGVTAQRLRYVDLLLVEPFVVTLGSAIGIPLEPPAEVSLANPVSFIAQKLLIHQRRHPEKRPHDGLYIHDAVLLFASRLNDLRELWREGVRPSLPPRTAARVERPCPRAIQRGGRRRPDGSPHPAGPYASPGAGERGLHSRPGGDLRQLK